MKVDNNFNVFVQVKKIEDSSGNIIGTSINRYTVQRYKDVNNLGYRSGYLVMCTQKFKFYSGVDYEPIPDSNSSFLNYPALISNKIMLSGSNLDMDSSYIFDYSPKTINTSLSTDINNESGSTTGYTKQHTIGSSTSNTNSYGISASVGFMGDVPTGSLSGSFDHSTTHGTDDSSSKSKSQDKESQMSISDSMTIKDWGSYAQLENDNFTPVWIWGQEFPWNVIKFKSIDSNNKVSLPAYVSARLFDGTILFPPSELSLFGVEFICKASWLIFPKSETAQPDEIEFKHEFQFSKGSHSPSGKMVQVELEEVKNIPSIKTPSLDLGLIALDPISSKASPNVAVIGFVPDKFTFPPVNGAAFKIISESNDIEIRGVGFNSPMFTDFSKGAVKIDIYFKIDEVNSNRTLFFKHWKNDEMGVVLQVVVNQNDPLLIHVDAMEGKGGEKNISSLTLRDKDFSSIDYCDYLVLGLNKVSISFTPSKDTSGIIPLNCGYTLKAIAIE